MRGSRRRVLGGVVLLLTWFYATGLSLYFVLSALTGSHKLEPSWLQVLSVLFGVLILVLSGFWLVLFVRDLLRGEGQQYLLSRTPRGTARISLRAIQASLLRRAREMDEVIGAKVSVRRLSEDRLRVEAAYTTTDDQNAITVSETLRGVLRERFREIVQPEEGFEVEFDVKIDGFVPGSIPEERPAPKKDEAEPFTGPRYPID
jgi:hypothetical protein